MGRSRVLLVSLAAVLAAGIVAGAVFYLAKHRSTFGALRANTAAANGGAPIIAGASTSGAASARNSPEGGSANQPETASLVLSDIQFIPREKITAINFSDKNGDSDTDTSYEFYRVGHFVRGPWVGVDLLEASVSQVEWPCKGDCGEPAIVRYIRKGSDLFALPKVSDSHAPDESVGRKGQFDLRPFKALGVTRAQALDAVIPTLDYPPTLADGPRRVLHLREEGVGTANPGVLQLAFHDSAYGDVWMTKPGLGPQKVFYEECKDVNPKAEGSEGGCRGLIPYTDNAFYFFRLDGTYLSYVYQPEFQLEDPRSVTWNGGPLPAGTTYVDHTTAGCSGDSVDSLSVVAPESFAEADLETIGKVNATGDPLYGLKDKNHQLYKEFYSAYDSSFPTWASQIQTEQTASEASYDDFVKAPALFLWKDPFGRMVRFANARFVRPQACEPILYLYPEQKRTIDVKLGDEVALARSQPQYGSGWRVSAEPDGTIKDLRSGRRMPYLFWEGHSYILPEQKKGFVVKSSDLRAFLQDTLPQFGLNDREAGDFIAAWSQKMNASPYYFITFLEQSAIDRYYPLTISPRPDTTIRVFMDFTPLSAPIVVEPLLLPAPRERHGFTVVEWGVLVR
jgi:hypothetical protein